MHLSRVRTFSPEVEANAQRLYASFNDRCENPDVFVPDEYPTSLRKKILQELFRVVAEFHAHTPAAKQRFSKQDRVYRLIKFPFTFLLKKGSALTLTIIIPKEKIASGSFKNVKEGIAFTIEDFSIVKSTEKYIGRTKIRKEDQLDTITAGLKLTKNMVKSLDPKERNLFVDMPSVYSYYSHNKVLRYEIVQDKYDSDWFKALIHGLPNRFNHLKKQLDIVDHFSIAISVAKQLEIQHRENLIHKDVSWNNILLEWSDWNVIKAYLNDFDLVDQCGGTKYLKECKYWDRLARKIGIHTFHMDVHGLFHNLIECLFDKNVLIEFFPTWSFAETKFISLISQKVKQFCQANVFGRDLTPPSDIEFEQWKNRMQTLKIPSQTQKILIDELILELSTMKRIYDHYIRMLQEEHLLVRFFRAQPEQKLTTTFVQRVQGLYHQHSARQLGQFLQKEKKLYLDKRTQLRQHIVSLYYEAPFTAVYQGLCFGRHIVDIQRNNRFSGALVDANTYSTPTQLATFTAYLIGYDPDTGLYQYKKNYY